MVFCHVYHQSSSGSPKSPNVSSSSCSSASSSSLSIFIGSLTSIDRSWKLFSQRIGDNVGGLIEMWELENLADYEKLMNRIIQDKEFQTVASQFYKDCVVPATYSINIWDSIM
jgi:hypothetical protein